MAMIAIDRESPALFKFINHFIQKIRFVHSVEQIKIKNSLNSIHFSDFLKLRNLK